MTSPTQDAGYVAEKRAMKFLKKQGLKHITSNYQTRYGEIDLVMSQQDTLVFIEVRLRNNASHGTGAESVTRAKQQRIINTAEHYLQYNPHWHQCRFDIMSMGDTTDWIQGAFTLD